MRARPNSCEYQHLVVYSVDKKPIRLYMAFAVPLAGAGEGMVAIAFGQGSFVS